VVGQPHFVAAYDLNTGRQLWQREALPLLCDGQPEAKARAVQVAIDLARAICLYGRTSGQPFGMVFGGEGSPNTNAAPTFRERSALVSRLLKKHRPAVEAIGDPDLLQALDADLALTTAWEAENDPAKLIQQFMAHRPFSLPKSKLAQVCQGKYKVPLTTTWSGHVGFADGALASDGERIYGVFGQGQIVCYDLDGMLVWVKREELRGNMLLPFGRTALLCGDRLLLKDALSKNIQCRDTRTGELVWTCPWPHNNFMALRHLRLNAPAGQLVDVIITPEHHKIIRVRDGKELGEFRAEKRAPHYHILAWDDTDTIAVGGKSTSGPTEPSAC
jgi:hypothetical protein